MGERRAEKRKKILTPIIANPFFAHIIFRLFFLKAVKIPHVSLCTVLRGSSLLFI